MSRAIKLINVGIKKISYILDLQILYDYINLQMLIYFFININ